jgi:hypothetical protein
MRDGEGNVPDGTVENERRNAETLKTRASFEHGFD